MVRAGFASVHSPRLILSDASHDFCFVHLHAELQPLPRSRGGCGSLRWRSGLRCAAPTLARRLHAVPTSGSRPRHRGTPCLDSAACATPTGKPSRGTRTSPETKQVVSASNQTLCGRRATRMWSTRRIWLPTRCAWLCTVFQSHKHACMSRTQRVHSATDVRVARCDAHTAKREFTANPRDGRR